MSIHSIEEYLTDEGFTVEPGPDQDLSPDAMEAAHEASHPAIVGIGVNALVNTNVAPETLEDRAVRINTSADAERTHKGQARELTQAENARIDVLTEQGNYEQAFHRVIGMTITQFYGQPTFNFSSPKALEFAEAILNERFPRKAKNYRPLVIRSIRKNSEGVSDISSTEASELIRLIELRQKNK